jgi:hypothetical protein
MSSADPSIHQLPSQHAPEGQIPLHSENSWDPEFEARAVGIVQQFFPGHVEVEESFDPSEPERKWHVLAVDASGSIEEIRAAKAAWRQRVIEEFKPAEIARFTLLVVPKPG